MGQRQFESCSCVQGASTRTGRFAASPAEGIWMNRRVAAVFTVSVAAIVAAASTPVDGPPPQERKLGSISFPNSGDASAQGAFIEGVLLLHSFEFEDAATAFRSAQDIDADFALAYWGEAMTYNHPLWRQQDKAAALAALARYAPTPSARQQKTPTEREAAYLAAIDALYADGSKTERDNEYMRHMSRLAANHPDDLEAQAFHSLAILGSTDGERDFAAYMKAAAVAQAVFDANPDHPGAVHYIIHSFDDPIHAPLGLKAARAYAEIAPGAGHAQHMTSHIFVAMGMWDDLVAANVRARNVQNSREAELGRTPNVCGHYTSWLHYGWLMRGDMNDAERGMAECRQRVTSGTATPAETNYFVNMRARHVLDTRDWDAAARLSADVQHPGYDFVTGFAAIQRGDRSTAVETIEKLHQMGANSNPRLLIAQKELEALVALRDGNGATAMALLREATEIEERLPFEFGPPASFKPPHELLGEVAMELGDHATAIAAFRAALDFTPERSPSLEGLIMSAQASDQLATAADAQARLDNIRSGSK
jgi:tetratricopeptide (TPR) repeat protein